LSSAFFIDVCLPANDVGAANDVGSADDVGAANDVR